MDQKSSSHRWLRARQNRLPGPQAPECDNTWHYSLAMAEVPNGKRFSISRLIFNGSGDIIFGRDIFPYAWPETGCPLAPR
jgi:hypothetical protein